MRKEFVLELLTLSSPQYHYRATYYEAIDTVIGCITDRIEQQGYQRYSLAASPSPPGRSRAHARRSRAEGERGSSKLCSRLIFTDQSDHTETIRFNFIHDSSSCKQAACGSDQPCESVWKGRLAKLVLPGCLPGYRTRHRLELALYRFTRNM